MNYMIIIYKIFLSMNSIVGVIMLGDYGADFLPKIINSFLYFCTWITLLVSNVYMWYDFSPKSKKRSGK